MRAATFAKQTGRTVSFALAAFRQAFAAGRDLERPRQRADRRRRLRAAPQGAAAKRSRPRASRTRCARRPTRPASAASTASPRWSSASEVFWGDDRLEEAVEAARELRSRSMADLPDAATCYELLARMALIRRFEEEAGRQYQRAKAGGFLHLAIGEEATIVGTTSVMRDEDYLIGTYRTHGHAIARGTEPEAGDGGAVRPRRRDQRRPRRLDAHLRRRAPLHGRLRDRRRQPADRRRARPSPPSTRAKTRSPSACSATAPPTPATSARR